MFRLNCLNEEIVLLFPLNTARDQYPDGQLYKKSQIVPLMSSRLVLNH